MRTVRWFAVGLAGLVAAGVAAGAAWNATDQRSPVERAERAAYGAALYAQHCAVCHGANLAGAPVGGDMGALPLVKPGFRFFFAALPVGMEGFIRDEIAHGENAMPPFAGVLTESEIAAIAAFVRERNESGG